MNIFQASGEGQGQCKLCLQRGKWNVHWMSFLYRIEGFDGLYCSKCVDELSKKGFENDFNDLFQTS